MGKLRLISGSKNARKLADLTVSLCTCSWRFGSEPARQSHASFQLSVSLRGSGDTAKDPLARTILVLSLLFPCLVLAILHKTSSPKPCYFPACCFLAWFWRSCSGPTCQNHQLAVSFRGSGGPAQDQLTCSSPELLSSLVLLDVRCSGDPALE